MRTRQQRIPGIDLHCHLDGSLPVAFIQREIGVSDLDEVKRRSQISDMQCDSLTTYLKKFDVTKQCLRTRTQFEQAAYEFIKMTALDHVIYVEPRLSTVILEHEDLTAKDILENVLEGLKRGFIETGIRSNVILCTMRGHSCEKNMREILLAREFLGDGVCGVDLAGDESRYSTSLYRDIFRFARTENIPFTIHAGECGNAENVKEAIELGASRIGHGIAMRQKRSLLKLCVDRQIGIEMCPISNYQTKAVAEGEKYPLREFLQAGVCVTVNTDNRTVSNTTLEKEFYYLRNHLGVTEEEELLLTEHAIKCSFADDSIKQELWEKTHCRKNI